MSAEIEVVPAGAARDYGFDRCMVMGYGHDDRVCAYPSFPCNAGGRYTGSDQCVPISR